MQGGDEELNIHELTSNISTYKDQLQHVKLVLVDDPRNSEYKEMEKDLEEVIALTDELLATAKQNEDFASVINMVVSTSDGQQNSNGMPQYDLDSMLEHQDRYPVGTKIQAVWSEDGEWHGDQSSYF